MTLYRVAVVETDGRETVREVEVTPAAPDQRACDRQAQLHAKVLRGETPTRQELDTSRDEWHLRNPATAAIAEALGATRRELTREEMRRLDMEDSRPTYVDAVLPDGSILAPIFQRPRSVNLTGETGGTSDTFSHNCGSGADRAVIAFGSRRAGGSEPVSGITYDGVALTDISNIGTTGTGNASVWKRTMKRAAGASTGANDVVVSYTAGGASINAAVTATGVDTTTIHRTPDNSVVQSTTSDRTDTVNPTSQVGDLVIATARIAGFTVDTITPGTGQTSFFDQTNNGYGRGSSKAGEASSTEMSYRMQHGSSLNLAVALSGFALIPASGLTAVQQDADLRWSLLSAAQQDLETRWAILNAVQQDTDLRWAILNSTQADIELRWAVIGAAQADVDLRWEVLAALSAVHKDVDLRWALLSAAEADLDVRWALLNALQKDAELRWALLSSTTVDVDLRWSVVAAVSQDAELQWEVLSALTGVSKDVDLRWSLIAAAQNDMEMRWAILNAAQQDVEFRWAVISYAQQDVDFRWGLLSAAFGDLDLRWSVVIELLQVHQDLDMRWSLVQAVHDSLDVRWSILNSLFADVDLRWAVAQAVASSLEAQWSILGSAAKDAELRWTVVGVGERSLELRWTFEGVLGTVVLDQHKIIVKDDRSVVVVRADETSIVIH
jgi:hypothetical protein